MAPRRKVSLGIAAFVVVILAAAGWLGFRYMETKALACECENPIDEQRFALWNPLRYRSPEHIGGQVLRVMQSGNCQSWPATGEDTRSGIQIQNLRLDVDRPD